jgi:ribosomal protein S12 methylthiotransferase accessory factor
MKTITKTERKEDNNFVALTSFLPIILGQSVISKNKTTFYTIDEEITVEAPSRLMKQLIFFCDGVHAYEEVIQSLSKEWDDKIVRELFIALRHKKIIVDARHISEEIWSFMENPSFFSREVTDSDIANFICNAKRRNRKNPSANIYSVKTDPVISLLRRRRSFRSFSGGSIPFQSLVNMVWSAYGEVRSKEKDHLRKTVPSAGGLYPLIIHVAMFKQTGDLKPAIYSVYLGHLDSVGFRFVSDDVLQFSRAFLGHLMFGKANGVIVISGSFNVTAEKYGNRSLLYVLLEAGHAVQNINLIATEHNVATVEVGGFVDSLLARAIDLPKNYHPLTTIVFGERTIKNQTEDPNPEIDVRWEVPINKNYYPPFAIVSARASKKRSWSHGRDASPILAYNKAISEAKEWAACGCIPKNLTQAQFSKIKTAIDPRSIVKFHPMQYRLKWFPFKPFDEKKKYVWTKGYNETTRSIAHILADLVYFPYFPKTPYYAYANSSGVAAYPNRQKAVEIGTLELIERDSFMIAYFTQLNFPTVYKKTLPQEIRNRIKKLKKVGFQIWIKDHSLDLAPVVFVFAQNKKMGCTTCASCSSFNIKDAVSHALMEVESFVLARLQKTKIEPIKPIDVEMPLDHGSLYNQRKYFRYADFLIRGKKKITFEDIGANVARSWPELINRLLKKGYNLYTVPLFLSKKYGGNKDLYIIRSIIPGIVPMTFGYRQEPAGMDRIYIIAKKFGNKSISYRNLIKFPHPFA